MPYILLAEDDKNLGVIFGTWLESGGHEVARADNGAEGMMKIIDERVPDLLITDLLMPVADGEALTLAFSSLAKGQPVIVVTACDDNKILESVYSEPAVKEILNKPISCEQLLSAVDRVLAG